VVSTALCSTEVQSGLAPSTTRLTFGQSVSNQRALVLKYGFGKEMKMSCIFSLCTQKIPSDRYET